MTTTPSTLKRLFVGDDAGNATKVPDEDLLHIAGPFGPIMRVSSTNDEDTITFSPEVFASLALGLSRIYLGTLTVSDLIANTVYQRDTRTGSTFSKGAGVVPVTISATEVMVRVEYRLRDAASPTTTLVDWTEVDFQRVSGSQVVDIPVPAGLYKYLIDIRPNSDDAKAGSTTQPVMMGEVRAFAGQSLAQEFIDTRPSGDTTTIASLGLTVSPWAWIWASTALNSGAVPQVADFSRINFPVTAWAQSSDAGPWDSAWAVQYQNKMISLTGVPCGLVGYAVGGTGIATWLPGYSGGGTAHYEDLVSTIQNAGGKFGGFLWCQGHYESKNGTTASEYLDALEALFTALAASFPTSGAFYQIISTIPAIGAYSGATPTTINMVRATAKGYVAGVSQARYIDGLDIALMPDLVHYTQAAAINYANEWWRADAALMGLATYGNNGPLITSAVRAYGSADIVLSVSQVNGGTSWVTSGSIANQFTVYPAGTLSGALTISSVNTSNAAQITITLSAPPSEPASLDIWYRISPDDSTIVATTIRDNVTGDSIATGRQLALVGTAVTASIPVVALTISSIADANAGTSISVSGTYTNGLPTSLEYSSNQGATWTAASSPTIGSGNYSFTIGSGLPVGVYSLWVRDPLSGGSVHSNTFVMAQASPATLPTITSPVFGLNASAGQTHFYTDTGRTVQAIIGDAVRGVADLTGTGNHFIQPSTTLAPQYQANIKNGLPGLRFTGTTFQFLELVSGGTLGTTLQGSSGFTIFLVYTPAALPAVAYSVFATGVKATSGGYDIIRGAQGLAAASVRASRNFSSGAFYNVSVAAATAGNQLNKQVTRYDGTNLKAAINAIAEASIAAGSITATPFDFTTIGVEWGAGSKQFYLDGWVHELRVWNSAASDANRTNLLNYGTSQWGS